MKAETIAALKKSIAHWQRLANGTRRPGENIGCESCALCVLFFRRDCKGCPVEQATGKILCSETPYFDAFVAYSRFGPQSGAFKAAAAKELAFLRSLLPTDSTK